MARPRWTPEQAREMGERGRKAIQAAREAKRQISATLTAIAHDSGFLVAQHTRMRALLETVLSRAEEEAGKVTCDGQRLNWLATALERLAEIERVMDGRPLPGSRRPPSEDPPAARPTQAPRPPAIPTPASATTPAASIPAPSPGEAPQAQTSGRLLSEPPEF